MWEYMKERAQKCAEYIVETECTVRACAKQFSVSKSTVHKDVTERLQEFDPDLYEKVKRVLDVNLSERHLRGGNATKKHYEEKHRLQSALPKGN